VLTADLSALGKRTTVQIKKLKSIFRSDSGNIHIHFSSSMYNKDSSECI
jgi:hypothetical protein